MLHGLDLFSGIGGITLALRDWVRPVAYCEVDPYVRGVLLSRMADGHLPAAPVWDDVRTLGVRDLPLPVDIIYGGFPCQDISVAGLGRGLAGERSGLVFEVLRLVAECQPTFVFLENVPAIRTRGGERVVKELAALGYDCRWDVLSAYDVGAPHKRERWFLLAHKHGDGQQGLAQRNRQGTDGAGPQRDDVDGLCNAVSDWSGHAPVFAIESNECRTGPVRPAAPPWLLPYRDAAGVGNSVEWWAAEPGVGRVAHGVSARAHRLRALGNAVVPAQAREAFARLAGLD